MRRRTRVLMQVGTMVMLMLAGLAVTAQTADGNAGLTQANTMIRGYFDTATQVMYAIGALLGLGGAIHVFYKMSQGDRDTGHAAAWWFGACIFLVLVATVIKSFFGL